MVKGPVEWVAWILLMVGGLNWGLFGLLHMDLVETVFIKSSNFPILAQLVYLLVGLSALYTIFKVATCKKCNV